MTTVIIRDVDDEVYRMFKSEAIRAGYKVREAAIEAFKLWVKAKRADTKRLAQLAAERMDRNRRSLKTRRDWDSTEELRRWRSLRSR